MSKKRSHPFTVCTVEICGSMVTTTAWCPRLCRYRGIHPGKQGEKHNCLCRMIINMPAIP